MNDKARLLVFSILAAVLGFCSVILPVFILSLTRHDAPLFPLVRTAIEGLSALAFVFLFISGLILGALCPKHPVRLGLCTMAAFPLLAFAEMVTDSTSHNLWPIEFVMYGVMSLAAVCGAYIARSARRWGSKHA